MEYEGGDGGEITGRRQMNGLMTEAEMVSEWLPISLPRLAAFVCCHVMPFDLGESSFTSV